MFEITGKYTTAKVMIDDVEQSCIGQIVAMVNHPAFTNPIAIMPDTHAGKGSVIGFTMEMGDKIIPNIVGVDIGCGMLSFCAGPGLFDGGVSVRNLDSVIRRSIPFGTNIRRDVADFNFNWKELNETIRKFTLEFNKRFGMSMAPVVMDDMAFELMCKRVGANHSNVMRSVGTLGGGNHFIEIGMAVGGDDYWITIHSGSRNFGKCVAEYWQKRALVAMTTPDQSHEDHVEMVKRLFPKKEWGHRIAVLNKSKKESGVPKGMEYLTGSDMFGYLIDMMIAQNYASVNRQVMKAEICNIIGLDDIKGIETVHNFIDFRDWMIRKGAIRSYKDEMFILPFNMRDGILFCWGGSNVEWNNSAPHGAGRVYSRSQAKATINKKVAEAQMEGIYTSCIPLDEAPDAYKDAKVIEAAIEPTATIVCRVKPVMNMKCAE